MYVWIHSEQENVSKIIPFVHRIDVRNDDGPWCIVIETCADGSLSVAANHTVTVEKDTE